MKMSCGKFTVLETNKLLYKIVNAFLLSNEYIVNTTTEFYLTDETHFRGIYLSHVDKDEIDKRVALHKGLVSIYDLHLKYQV